MKNKKTILVSGASGIVGYGILKSLRLSSEKYNLIGTTIYEDSVASAFSDIFIKAPLTSDVSYLGWLLELIKKYEIDMVIPSIEDDVFLWNKYRNEIHNAGAFALLNNENLINLSKDKWDFYQELKKYNSKYAIPTNNELEKDNLKFPFLLKPRRGYASKGIVIVKDEETLSKYISDIGTKLIIQPIIGSIDEEYTVSAFFDTDSKLCAYIPLRRKLSKEGYTEIAYTVEMPNLLEALNSLADIFKPIGPTNFQFRLDGSELKLLEINPRISSATSIRSAFGHNEAVMSVDYFLNGKKCIQSKLKSGKAIRYSEDVIYYDN